jgi:hypothetical protein
MYGNLLKPRSKYGATVNLYKPTYFNVRYAKWGFARYRQLHRHLTARADNGHAVAIAY